MGEGFSQPFSKTPMSRVLLRQNSSNSFPLVSVTSLVLFLLSFGGTFNWAFHSFSGTFWALQAGKIAINKRI